MEASSLCLLNVSGHQQSHASLTLLQMLPLHPSLTREWDVQYVRVTQDELKAVASYISACGRVSLSQLAAKSGDLLQPRAKAADAPG